MSLMLESLTYSEKLELLSLLAEQDRRRKRRKFFEYYPEEGPLSRHAYPKHMKFFAAGKNKMDRAVLAGNRVGKTEGIGGYELACHLTGLYPAWWEGHRFNRSIQAWAAGKTGKTTRDILQHKFVGPIDNIGTGIIPGEKIISFKRSGGGVPDQIENVKVQHVSGGISQLVFKSYEQGRGAFEGTEQDVILLDEEAPAEIRAECLLRLMATGGERQRGLLMTTFTPLEGLTELVLTYLPGGKIVEEAANDQQFLIMISWDDAPHLSEEEKQIMLSLIPPYQRKARTKGIPQLGAGAIYPIPEEEITITDFAIPDHWPRAYGFDVGWNATGAVWGALDRESGIGYLYSCYKRGEAEPPIHTEAIKARGIWIPGVIDPAARGRSQADGERLFNQYIDLGLDLSLSDNAVEAGIFQVWTRLSAGTLKVFKSMQPWFEEYRIYRRDEKGKVVKVNDHLMDCTRYLELSGWDIASVQVNPQAGGYDDQPEAHERSWMGN